jgi:superfamily II DNA/RNA helicase
MELYYVMFDETCEKAMAIPALLNGDDVLCASQTGSGKTLAYLLPIIQALKYEVSILFKNG